MTRELRARETAWFEHIVDESPNLVFVNKMGRVVYANSRSMEVTGFSADEITATDFDFMTLIAPESHEAVRAAFARHSRGEEVEPYEYVLLNRRGERIEVVNSTRIIDYEGGPAILGVITDISVRKRVERELRASEERYRTLLETCPDGIFAADLEGNILMANEAAAQLRGFADVETLLRDGGTVLESVAPEQRGSAAQAMAETLAGDGVRRYEYDILDASGERSTPVEVTGSALRDPDGVVTGLVGVLRDLTERRAAEAERRRLEAQVQHGQRLESLGVLAGGIAHDFNNLLVGILGNAGLAMGQVPADAPVRGSLEQIGAAAQRAAVLVEQMLTYAGRGALTRQSLCLSELVAEMAHLLEAAMPKAVSLEYDFAEDTPAVAGDTGQLQQVAMNLITNAAEAMTEPGVVHIRVGKVAAAQVAAAPGLVVAAPAVDGDFVCLTVEDSGSGMDEQTRGRIFEPFFTTKFTGRGLGLAAVIGIVRGHQGSLAVDTVPGRGTRFSVFLPVAPPESTLPEVVDERPAETPALAQGTVLVVDDEELVRSLASRTLEAQGYCVITACDGAEAIVQVRDHPIDLVLLDLTMPRVSGVEALAAIHELRPELPVILSSGYSERDAQDQVGNGVAAFVQKPYLPAHLVGTVVRVLGRG